MGSFGGFYKGEKKKQKKDKLSNRTAGDAPVFVLPEIIKKKENSR
jgi:hypothetical protein